jgi:hypothetical protein
MKFGSPVKASSAAAGVGLGVGAAEGVVGTTDGSGRRGAVLIESFLPGFDKKSGR